jgi:hypothetical protein
VEPDISILRKSGHFYFALTGARCKCRCKMRMSGLSKVEMSAFIGGRRPFLHEVKREQVTQIEAARRKRLLSSLECVNHRGGWLTWLFENTLYREPIRE